MKDPNFKIKEIRGLSTILYAEPFPDDLMKGVRFANNVNSTNYYEYALKKHFKELFKDLFSEYGLKYERENWGVWIPEGKRKYFSIGFQKEIIIPHKDIYTKEISEMSSEGYEPRAEIEINKKQNEIGVKLFLEYETRMMSILGELMNIERLNGNGIEKPRISLDGKKIFIAGAQWFKPFVEEAKRFYGIIGEEKMKDLSDLRYAYDSGKEPKIKEIISKEYKSQLETLSLPTKNF